MPKSNNNVVKQEICAENANRDQSWKSVHSPCLRPKGHDGDHIHEEICSNRSCMCGGKGLPMAEDTRKMIDQLHDEIHTREQAIEKMIQSHRAMVEQRIISDPKFRNMPPVVQDDEKVSSSPSSSQEKEEVEKKSPAEERWDKTSFKLKAGYTPQTAEELAGYLNDLTTAQHDYNSSAEAIVSALCATANFIYHKLGNTGFQAGWARLEYVAMDGRFKNGFQLVDYRNVLYPQYDIFDQLAEGIFKNLSYLTEEAKFELEKDDKATQPWMKIHPDVRARMEEISKLDTAEKRMRWLKNQLQLTYLGLREDKYP